MTNYVGGNQYNNSGGGDQYNVSDNAIGRQQNYNYGAADGGAAYQELLRAVNDLRSRVSAADRQALDEQLSIVAAGPQQDQGTLRRALTAIAGVATVVGEVGAPVITAVRAVLGALA